MRQGVVFYLKNKRVVGVVVWNLPDKIPIARKAIDSHHSALHAFPNQFAVITTPAANAPQIIREAKQHESFAPLAALFKINAPKDAK